MLQFYEQQLNDSMKEFMHALWLCDKTKSVCMMTPVFTTPILYEKQRTARFSKY